MWKKRQLLWETYIAVAMKRYPPDWWVTGILNLQMSFERERTILTIVTELD